MSERPYDTQSDVRTAAGAQAGLGMRATAAACPDGQATHDQGDIGAAHALELRGLAVGHGARALVSDIDLVVDPGEVVALIGPNGSGKTTILHTVAGQLRPLAGSVELFGHELASLTGTERARTMAALFTDRPRTDLLTCQDIVEAGRHPYTGSLGILSDEDHRRVREAMEATDTWALRDRDFAHMSDGQRQRALIARALCQEPRVLLLDEPTSYLDIRSQVDMLQLLRAWARERGMAVLASLHEIDLAQKAADRIACVRDGHIMFQGTPDEVFTSDVIPVLYDLDSTSYDPFFGGVELARPEGEPQVFVIAGGGAGATIFRALQRQGIPFAAGVLHRHDIDGLLASHLAVKSVFEDDFEPVGEDALRRAADALRSCRAVICPLESFGALNARNAELLDAARDAGIPVVRDIEQLGRVLKLGRTASND
ncbi:ABC transporter ATP-binding protein [Collinsella sp. An2]|uniref:ABC transporter ATP-binding protein n=1 Tax=Collinsella sp. An2 TaxID=1965585 RepID=UPI000B57FA51|nr:ABC transporter ATP-binding protein [Collinsella sp. An2]OUP09175.1 hypothetical protein B5F33_05430 [Collinsella sp. An2]